MNEQISGEKVKKAARSKMKRLDTIFIICMLAVPIAQWFVFWLYANIQSLTLAFQLPTGEWTLNNFKAFFQALSTPGNIFGEAFSNTMMWFAFDLVVFVWTLILNYFLYKKMPGYKIWRIGIYVPVLLSQVVVVAMVNRLVRPDGPLGELIGKVFGLDPVPLFFYNSKYANAAMLIYGFWGSWGANMLIFGGTFARIPDEIIEAGKLDGCSPGRELVQIIVPLISPTLITMMILKFTGIFSASGPILLFTQGQYGTTTLAYWIFDTTRFGSAYNTVSAVGMCMTAVAVPVILTIRWLLEKIPVVEI